MVGRDGEAPPLQPLTLLGQVCQKHYNVTPHVSNFISVATQLS